MSTYAMWYDRGPQPDARYGRSLISKLTKAYGQFARAHELATLSNNPVHFREANEARTRVKAACSTIWRQRENFPADVQTNFDTVVGQVCRDLDARLAFPEYQEDDSQLGAYANALFPLAPLPDSRRPATHVSLPIHKPSNAPSVDLERLSLAEPR